MDIELLKERSSIIRGIRDFFVELEYIETDTPLLSTDLIPETCLEVFQTMRLLPGDSKNKKERPLYLIPSPEIYLKKLISKYKENIFEICKCFRNGESTGFLHSSEFTMLEYYTMNANYIDSITLTEKLFLHLLKNIDTDIAGILEPPFLRITIEEAFVKHAGFSLQTAMKTGTLKYEASKAGIIADNADDAALYDLLFIHCVEPNLPKEKPVVLTDYPALVPCLAKLKNPNAEPHEQVRERWELYVNGIELANCYSEETDACVVKEYFERESKLKEASGLVKHEIDRNYYKVFEGFPDCSGVALGVDRLIMALLGKKSIDTVLPFPVN